MRKATSWLWGMRELIESKMTVTCGLNKEGSSSLREAACEEQGLGEHDILIFGHVDFVVLIGPIQMVVRYKELELRGKIWAEDKDLGMAMGEHELSGVQIRELRTKSWGTQTLTAGQRRALKWQPHLLCDVR